MKILYIVLFVFFGITANSQNVQTKADTAPEEEFLAGKVQTFNTKGHHKSKGTDWSVKLPLSWAAEEADGQNIIQKFISREGEGIEAIMLSAANLPMGSFLSKKDIDEFFTETGAREMIPDGSKFLSFEKMRFDGIDGSVIYYEAHTSYRGIDVTLHSTQYLFIYKNQLYTMVCNVPLGEGAAYSDPKKFAKLFRLVAGSIVVNKGK